MYIDETEAKRKIQQLQGEYDDILALAKMEMAEVENLHYSTLCFVPNPKKEHQELVKKAIQEAKSREDDKIDVGKYRYFLHYPMLEHIIKLYGSHELKEKMMDYVSRVGAFRKETKLCIFSKVDDGPSARFGTTLSAKLDMDWTTATLDDVEQIRIQICEVMEF